VLGFIAIALVIWLVGPFIAIADHRILESVVARLIATLIVLVVWLAVLLIRQLRAKRADKQLIEGMAEAEEAAPARDAASHAEAAEEKEELKRRFQEAVEVLRQPKEKGQRKATSLYELPWYIIFRYLRLIDTYTALTITHLIITMPMVIWLMVSFFESMPSELEDAAMIDGEPTPALSMVGRPWASSAASNFVTEAGR